MRFKWLLLLMTSALLLSSCSGPFFAPSENTVPTTSAKVDGQASDSFQKEGMYMDSTENVIYLAGSCFWGMEHLMQSIPVRTIGGFAYNRDMLAIQRPASSILVS